MIFPHIIVYQGGAGGDMICAVIDKTDYHFDGELVHPIHRERIHLRNNDLIESMTDEDRDAYISQTRYKSLPSHLANYHIQRKHPFIHIDCSEPLMAEWITKRFHSLYDGHDWYSPGKPEYVIESSNKTSQFASVNIQMRDILEGKLIDVLQPHIDTPLNESLYKCWLNAILSKHPVDNKCVL